MHLRFGVILSPRGGALAKMLTPFRLGLGGRIGSGRQWMSWIALDDAVGSIYHAMCTERLGGPVNAVSPNPVTNLEFTKTLGKILWRPTIFLCPASWHGWRSARWPMNCFWPARELCHARCSIPNTGFFTAILKEHYGIC